MTTLFRDRKEAGQQLASQLTRYANRSDVMVIALPRGGVPVAFEVAEALKVPLDICLVRKLGVPGNKEIAMGAIATGGVRILNDEVVNERGISSQAMGEVTARELEELHRRELVYRGDRPSPVVRDSIILLVDDGVATGASIRAAIAVLREQQPKQIVVAVPVAQTETFESLKTEVDELICMLTPKPFNAIALWYKNFAQTTDGEVCKLLKLALERNTNR